MRDFIDINSNDNALFTTSMCSNRCLMCCQPPVQKNDIDSLWSRNIRLIDTAPKQLSSIGVTGGEPTLLGERFFKLLTHLRTNLPDTEIHILTNGRAFASKLFALKLAAIGTDKILIGIPLHSDNQLDHDTIAGANNAFIETMRGLYNLARFSFDIELRVVLTKLNFQRLPNLARFIYKNLPFVRYVSFMGLEYTGYVIKNSDKVWIDPVDYQTELSQAVSFIASTGIDASIFNLTHCILSENLWPYARKSISDWKNTFEGFCDHCRMRAECCGLFSTSRKQSQYIHPIR